MGEDSNNSSGSSGRSKGTQALIDKARRASRGERVGNFGGERTPGTEALLNRAGVPSGPDNDSTFRKAASNILRLVPGVGLVASANQAAQALGLKGELDDFSAQEVASRDLSEAGQLRREVRTSPARNVQTATQGADRVDAGKVASIVQNARGTPEGDNARNRRLRVANQRPRRSSIRIDFKARAGATRSGVSVNN